MLHDEGTRVVKFFLHISKEYQRNDYRRGWITRTSGGSSIPTILPNASAGMST
jgi:hypothetical protein